MILNVEQVNGLVDLVVRANGLVNDHYQNLHPQVIVKDDKSPVTKTDQEVNDLITAFLNKHYPGIPVLSEEAAMPSVEVRRSWNVFWLVDPLDGTKEFLKRTGNFTVNIALIVAGRVQFGIVGAPVYDHVYVGQRGEGAFKYAQGRRVAIKLREIPSAPTILISQSHRGREYDAIKALGPDWEVKGLGSSLKFCLLAEGQADIYLRRRETNEWDTAAGQGVLESAGGQVRFLNGEELTYNKESILNGGFIAGNLQQWEYTDFLCRKALEFT